MALPPRDQRHQYLRFKGLQYTYVDIMDFETRLGKIYSREVHRVLVLDFESLPAEIAEGLTGKMLMEHRDAQGTPPSYTLIKDLMPRLYHRLIACSIAGRSQAPEKFIARLAEHFGLLTEERLQGLAVIVRDLHIIDMAELTRLQICEELVDTWAWVAPGPERQPPFLYSYQGYDAKVMPQAHHLEVMDAMARDLSRFTVWAAGGISQQLDSIGATYVQYSETHVPYQRRRVRQRTVDASTLAAPLDEDQLDP
ncbi:hypothetical protein Tco_0917535 [Tanacetum coccineum]